MKEVGSAQATLGFCVRVHRLVEAKETNPMTAEIHSRFMHQVGATDRASEVVECEPLTRSRLSYGVHLWLGLMRGKEMGGDWTLGLLL